MSFILHVILIFFTVSVLGWCIEVTLKWFQYHRFINRGFLTGPWLPIYGSGAALITVAVNFLGTYESGPLVTFVVSFFLCGTLEYLTSYVMEKRFHARWWDYSKKPMNLNGRVWIGNLLLFGVGGVFIVHVLDPLLIPLFSKIPTAIAHTICTVLGVLFLTDCVSSHFILKLVKTEVEHSEADNTEAIGREIRATLTDRSVFHRRFANAYPEVVYYTDRISETMNALKNEAEKKANELNQMVEDKIDELALMIEPNAVLKSEIIEKQEDLLALLYNEEQATEEMRALRREIDAGLLTMKERSN